MDKETKKEFEKINTKFEEMTLGFENKIEKAVEGLAVLVQKGFVSLENRMDGLGNRMYGLENRMDGLENRMYGLENRIDNVEENMATKSDIDKILNILDAGAKRDEDNEQELAALSGKVDRHEEWITAIAKKTRVELKY